MNDIEFNVGIKKQKLLEIKENNALRYFQEKSSILVLDYNIEDHIALLKRKHTLTKDEKLLTLRDYKRNQRINLHNSDNIWEGDVLNELPFGFGCLYNKEGILLYKGCMFNGNRECYGESYHSNSVIEYKGSYYNNMRHGWGELFNNEGKVIYNGLWYFDKNCDITVLVTEYDVLSTKLHSFMEELLMGENSCNTISSLKLVEYNYLKKIVIGNRSLKKVTNMHISSCPMLESLIIGDHCACTNNEIIEKSVLSIQNLNSLTGLIIGNHSYIYYHTLDLRREIIY